MRFRLDILISCALDRLDEHDCDDVIIVDVIQLLTISVAENDDEVLLPMNFILYFDIFFEAKK